MVSAINSSAVLLSWEASSSTASGFTVTYTSPQGSSGVLSLNSSARSVVITSLSPDQEYQFTVAITGESPSASVSITLPPAGMYAGREGRGGGGGEGKFDVHYCRQAGHKIPVIA